MGMVIRHLDTVIVLGLVAAVGIILWLMFGESQMLSSNGRQVFVTETYPVVRSERAGLAKVSQTTCSEKSESRFVFINSLSELDLEHFVVTSAEGFLNSDNSLWASFEFAFDTPEPYWSYFPLIRVKSLDDAGNIVTDSLFAPWHYHRGLWYPSCMMGDGFAVGGSLFLGELADTDEVNALIIEFCDYVVSPGQNQCRSGATSQ